MTVMPSIDNLVLGFAAIEADALASAGGKAVNLGVLTRAGLPVPPGVCVTTEAYRDVAGFAGLDRILDAIAQTDPSDVARLAALAADARAALLAAPAPDWVTDAIVDGYHSLGVNVPVAVRSSANAEDLPFASFAGQHDTYLNVLGAASVLQAVRRCWASLWTDRAVAYRASNGIHPRTVQLAVVIQRMVDAAVAGVMFTANPVTGRRGQTVIDASPGLGEAVVSGAVNPDHFVVNTRSGEIVERRLGDKQLVILSLAGGGTQHVERIASADDACLTDAQVRALAALGDRVQRHYGSPQDTEWAVDADGRLWLTQARPITTLFPLPADVAATGEPLRVYFCFSVAQGLYRPITPMGLAAFRMLASSGSEILGFPVADPAKGPMRYAEAGLRCFADVTGVLRSRAGRTLFPRVLDVMEARSAEVMRRLADEPRLSLTRRSWLPLARRVLRIAARYGVPITALRAVISPDKAHEHAVAIGAQLHQRFPVREDATSAERLDLVQRMLLEDCVSLVPRIMPSAAAGFGLLAAAGRVLGDDASAEDLQSILRALPRNITTEMDLELWALASLIRKERDATDAMRSTPPAELAERFRAGALHPVAQRGLAEFLSRYGHRAVAEIDVGLPRWSDDPEHILGVIANYLRLEDPDAAPDALFARRACDAEAMIDTLTARARRRGVLRGAFVRFALRRARALAGLRELPKFHLVSQLAAVRRQLSAVGADLAARGRIECVDDVFFLDLEEARAALSGRDVRAIVAERRRIYNMELRRRHVPRVLLSDGTEPDAHTSTASDGALTGTPASAGSVTGTARVILDPIGARLEPGEILVAPSTDPGWTPLFLTAGALVMEMGGANSHGAVVAREYGIPAVVGVPNATSRIVTGQQITVDGTAGRVAVN